MNGVLVINKPRGMTSHDVVALIRRKTGVKRVGHAGTLDPLAEGVLIILLGKATKRQKEFLEQEKEYLATLHLGATSATDDAEGIIKPIAYGPSTWASTELSRKSSEYRVPSRYTRPGTNKIRKVLANFTGEIEQTPPLYSAVKVSGKRAYKLARKGERPKLKPKKVTIYEIKLLRYRWPYLEIKVRCASGTYIRALARDIGQILGCGAYLEKLIRTRIGQYRIEDAQRISRCLTDR